MARRSVVLNGLEKDIEIVTGDIKDASELFGASSFDIITTNPPYMIGRHGLQNGNEAKTIARHEILCDLEDILRGGQTDCSESMEDSIWCIVRSGWRKS